ncbi:Gfo/Idh/MocA family oxidoreductase [Ferruginibacter lapsinanis]|uniref:Gfo/Idh/MocA family oxidoreductase n=1 Tax=Ferruginibacter lapsinanis TaxID=563172 RepID=UPI001E41DC17|nr:Gfo/Idh/MocA family oxidoreductase [Ferruginibacter lapsinanis]UEG49931.1 Gfo/Idh/MocA family oxidoreductase [Ferruginibacter lapsinanis]
MATPIKTALLSFGMSGRVFHAPFISLHPGFQLMGAWERSTKAIQQHYPDTRSYQTLEELLADETIELVIVNTPTYSHYEYAKKALLADKHIVVEKAFTTTVEEAIELKILAEKQHKKIAVFQNRRWDSDFKTVQKVITDGLLGELNEAEIHFDRYNLALSPKQHKEVPGPGAGILKDLGPHLIDQALCLFGMPQSLFADIRITRKESSVDDWFDILLYYPSFRIRLKAGYIVKEPLPSYIFHGTKGSFLKSRADIQEPNLLAGMKPNLTDWGTEPASEQGLLHIEKDGTSIREKIPSLQGNYYDYYDEVYKGLTKSLPMPVSADDGINVMRIIEAAITSNAGQKVINFN